MSKETDTKYNAGVIDALEKELLGPVERQRLHKAPLWTRLVVNTLIRRIANLRKQVYELQKCKDIKSEEGK